MLQFATIKRIQFLSFPLDFRSKRTEIGLSQQSGTFWQDGAKVLDQVGYNDSKEQVIGCRGKSGPPARYKAGSNKKGDLALGKSNILYCKGNKQIYTRSLLTIARTTIITIGMFAIIHNKLFFDG